ncbi:hypothetical protein BJ944DRAFT_241220 [Cunninghamella echinulata]|nr:hypothetical protein BJ944DRAFT_241220 [Cunninghamella echinulata]
MTTQIDNKVQVEEQQQEALELAETINSEEIDLSNENNNDNNNITLEKKISKTPTTTIDKKKLLFGKITAVCLMILSGCCIALQAGVNAKLNRTGGRSFASVISFAVGLACCIAFFIFDMIVFKTPPPSFSKLKSAPPYAFFGGILGSYYVIINILTVPYLGAATVLSIFVCSQVITACLMDHFGLLGVPKRKYTIWRIIGSLGLVGCVAVITIF